MSRRCIELDISGMGSKKRKRINKILRNIKFKQLLNDTSLKPHECRGDAIRIYMHRKAWAYVKKDSYTYQHRTRKMHVDEFLERFGHVGDWLP